MDARSSGVEEHVNNFEILDLPVAEVMRPEIALPLQHMLRIYTIGAFLRAWDNPHAQRSIEHLFESAEQAQHAATTVAAMAGWTNAAAAAPHGVWWKAD
ncbi:MAG TPA: hypothetical protein PK402_05945 [Tepidisphaeraceae bacterium]|nr:hypothetical protein [Tepidisphaeraceae bacterium]